MNKFFLALALCLSCVEAAETRILYIRHGEVPGNDPNPATYIYTGSQTDDSLTDKGRAQAAACAQKISGLKIDAIYASPLKRAIETATPIAEALGLPVEIRPNLREINWGVADGQLVQKIAAVWGAQEQEVKRRYTDRSVRWDHLPVFDGAESFNALLARSKRELQALAEAHPNQTIVVVGHGRVLKTLIADAKDSEENIPYPSNCGIAEFSYSTELGLQFVGVVGGG